MTGREAEREEDVAGQLERKRPEEHGRISDSGNEQEPREREPGHRFRAQHTTTHTN